MGRPLSEIVNAALTDADQSMKLASARDAVVSDPGDFLENELKVAEEGKPCPECGKKECTCPAAKSGGPAAKSEGKEEKDDKEEKTSSAQQMLDDAEYGQKLAAALDHASGIVQDLRSKVAEGTTHKHTAAPGPEVMEAGHINETTKQPAAQTNSVPANQASHGGGPIDSKFQPQGIETNREDYKDPDWTKNKEAAAALVRAKVAAAEEYEQAGLYDAAERMIHEAQEIGSRAKLAADPSSPQASMPSHSTSFKLDTEPGPATHVPDNSGMISSTKASLKDKNQREAGEFMSEKAKKDNAVAANLSTTTGLKLSSLTVSAFRKHASEPAEEKEEKKEKAKAESEKDEKKEKAAAERASLRDMHESNRLQMGLGAAGGALGGGMIGASSPRNKAINALAGAVLGGGAGAGLGALNAAGNRMLYRGIDKAVGKGENKKASLTPDQVEAARSHLRKVAAKAQDPNATEEERQKAASLIDAVRSRSEDTELTPEQLLEA